MSESVLYVGALAFAMFIRVIEIWTTLAFARIVHENDERWERYLVGKQ